MAETTNLMTHWHDASRRGGNVVTIPTIWLAFVLSLLVHLAAMWEFLPRLQTLSGDAMSTSKAGEPLAVRLAAAPSVPPPPPPAPSAQNAQPTPARKAQASPPPKARAEKAVPRPIPPPPVVAVVPPASESIALPPPEPRAATPAPQGPRVEGDLSSFIAARRHARGDPEPSTSSGNASDAPSAENDIARRNRIVAGNLASLNTQTFGNEPKNSGGIFQIRRLGYDDAEFTFFGWNKEINRRASQKIEVKKGDNSDIRIAVVRRMIAIIRQYEQEDFSWSSRRLGRVVDLSARPMDNAGLEEFMMQEFFEAIRPGR